MTDGLVIVGAGPAAFAACNHLRGKGYDGAICIVGDEPGLPYERPPLSKAYMAGTLAEDELLLRPAEWYEENGIRHLAETRVAAVDVRGRSVVLANGESLPYEKLLIATGGTPRRLPGMDGERIATLRTKHDADRIGSYLAPGAKLAVLGGGFIGAEVAATARRKGVDVTIIEALDVPMKHALGAEIGDVYAQIHRDEGVRFELGSTIDDITEGASGLKLRTSRGIEIDCDLLVVGIGLVPNAGFLDGSGIDLDNGVVVDEFAETNVPGVYAAGDVANHWHPLYGRRMRVEHHDNALQQAACAMSNMLGEKTSYKTVHWVWSDQYEHNMQFAGSNLGCDEVVLRGSVDDRKFAVFYLKQGRMMAVLGVNNGREVVAARRLIATGACFDPAALRDPGVKLKDAVIANASPASENL